MANPITVLVELPRDETTAVRLERTTFRGEDIIVLREYYRDRDGLWRPTKRGINLKVVNWKNAIIPALLVELNY